MKKNHLTRRFLMVSGWLLAMAPVVLNAQTGDLLSRTWSVTDFPIPASMAAGAPAGSYSLSGIESVSLYNGKVNVAVPLLRIGGRGEAGYTMFARVNPPGGWRVETQVDHSLDCGIPWPEEQNGCYYRTDRPVAEWWNTEQANYGPGFVLGRRGGEELGTCPNEPNSPFYKRTLTHFVFTGPDGTEHALLDQGAIGLTASYDCALPGPQQKDVNRGTTFVSRDGSGLTFIAAQNIYDWSNPSLYGSGNDTLRVAGTLWQNDGTRYTIDSFGRITAIRDRNGNTVTLEYRKVIVGGELVETMQVSKVTDALNRKTEVFYSEACGNPYGTCDRITFSGTGGVSRTIRISQSMLKDALRADEATRYQSGAWELFENLPLANNVNADDTPVTSAVWLPDDRSYRFQFNRYLEVAKIVLPTGGSIEYDYGPGVWNGYASGQVGKAHSYGPEVSEALSYRIHLYRRVTERRVLANGQDKESVTTYSRPEALPGDWQTDQYPAADTSFVTSNGPVVERVYQGDGTTGLRAAKHHDYSLPGEPASPSATGSPAYFLSVDRLALHHSPFEGKEYLTEYLDGAAATVLKKEERTWQWNGEPRVVNLTGLSVSTKQLSGAMQTAATSFGYDLYNNETSRVESGFDGQAVRTTATSYYTNPTDDSGYLDAYLRRLVKKVSVFGATEESRTDFYYDTGSTQEEASGAPNLEAVSGARGNLVRYVRWLNGGTSPEVTRTYYDTGLLFEETNARNAKTTLTYDCGAAAVKTVTNALTHTVTITPDCSTLKPSSVKDPNDVITSFAYADSLDRVTAVSRGTYDRVVYEYLDAQKTLKTKRDKDSLGDGLIVNETLYDGLGRTVETREYGPGAVTKVQTKYDALGRVWQVSNPYQGTSAPDWTETGYDSLDRVISVTTPDVAKTLTEHDGATVTVTDPGSKKRKITRDALGRVVSVTEYLGSDTLATTYSYNALDNLLSVTQGTQSRTFTYDSLGRLWTAKSPETDRICYGTLDEQGNCLNGYDPNGNLVSRRDARGVVTTMGYDLIDRLTSKSYSGDSGVTLPVSYEYDTDQAIQGVTGENKYIGRLVKVSNSASTTRYRFDGLGRPLASQQSTAGLGDRLFQYTHKPAGMASMTYPSGRVAAWDYDVAGRVQSVSGVKDSVPTQYASQISYTAHGALASMTLGNTLQETWDYSPKRLQPRRVRVGAAGEWQMSYCASGNYETECATNNGNVLGTVILPLNVTQTYTFDGLNRLKTFGDSGGVNQTYVYDQYGNRALLSGTANGNYIPEAPPTPQVSADNAASVAAIFTNNRWTNATADAAGNLTQPATGAYPQMTYDGEGLVASAVTGSTASEAYSYDGEGRRVKKVAGSVVTYYVYSADGKLAAEYSTAGSSEIGTKYLTADHLGSTRLVTGSGGVVEKRYDYLPFGQELVAGVAGRTAALKYQDGLAADKMRVRFTGKERDVESGLDYFLARYYSGAQGRFTSPDEWAGGIVDPFTGQQVGRPGPLPYADITDPQTLNKYAYVRNNPLRYTDPDGHCIWDLCVGEGLGIYAAGAATVATATYLMTPQGKEATRAFVLGTASLINNAAEAINRTVFNQAEQAQSGAATSADAEKGAQGTGPDSAETGQREVRKPTSQIRKDWEKATGKPWPADPATGKPMQADHNKPLADGGSNAPSNITPRTPREHTQRHKDNGDFRRWGARARPNPPEDPTRQR